MKKLGKFLIVIALIVITYFMASSLWESLQTTVEDRHRVVQMENGDYVVQEYEEWCGDSTWEFRARYDNSEEACKYRDHLIEREKAILREIEEEKQANTVKRVVKCNSDGAEAEEE